MFQPSVEDSHTYFDYTINKYDNQVYLGNITEKLISHEELPSVNSNQENVNSLTCLYCQEVFPNPTQKFRHLGYCNVNICPVVPRRKWKQLKITNFLEEETEYQADSELSNSSQDSRLEMDAMIDSPTYVKKNKLNKKSINKEMFKLTEMMNGLFSPEKKSSSSRKPNRVKKYNLRKRKKTTSGSQVAKKIDKKISKKVRKPQFINKLEIVDILESLSLS